MSTVADDRPAMRKFCADVLALDETRDVVEIASLVDAWKSASTRVSVRNKAEAEAGVANVPRALNKVEVQELLVKFQNVHGIKLEDKTIPASTTLEQVFDQVEQGEFKNMSLVQFLSREDAEADILGATVEKGTGTLKIKKGYGECQKPRNPEEFRRRMSVVANSYLMAQLKYPQKSSLRGIQPQHFLKYLDLMLGDHVLGLKARDKDGQVIATPDFDLMLAYDYQVRRQMVKLVNEGATMAEALKEAMADTTIKERHFLTPNVYSQVSSTASSRSEGFRQRSRSQHGAGGHGMRSVGISPGARAKARRAAARARIAKASRFMTRRRMDVRFAGSGTTLESAAASTAAACMCANTALAVIQCMHVMVRARRTRLAPQPMVEKRLERGSGRSQPHPPNQKSTTRGIRSCRVLYLFSGASRKASVASFLQELAAGAEMEFEVHEIDIQNSIEWDLADKSLQRRLLQELAEGTYHVVLITPPCSTWSRVRGANCRGPPMIRSRAYPWGFPWLSKRHLKDAELGNVLIRFMVEVLQVLEQHPRSAEGALVLVFGEHPEDLGTIWREEDGMRMEPASIWQLAELRALVTEQNPLQLSTIAFNQCCWGAPYRKPTRLLTNLSLLKHWGPSTWPQFDSQGRYAGPAIDLCTCKPTVSLARTAGDTNFRTTATSIYPEAMDKAIAAAILHQISEAPPPLKRGEGRGRRRRR